jgi:hypothetical protein
MESYRNRFQVKYVVYTPRLGLTFITRFCLHIQKENRNCAHIQKETQTELITNIKAATYVLT